MVQKNNDIIYTTADIEKYHNGLLSSKERHALEKAALDDPFLADALEGYSVVPVNINEDTDELKKRLADRIEKSRSTRIPVPLPIWKIAAMIVLVAGAGLLVYQLGFNNQNNEIAQAAKKTPVATEQNILIKDSLATPGFDSSSKDVAIQQSGKALDYKKTESSSSLVSPNGTAASIATESNAVKEGDLASGLTEPSVPQITTPSVKADDKASEEKRSLRNDNAVDKSIVAEKNFLAKEKELSEKRKADADGDGVPDRFDGKTALKPAAKNESINNQGFAQYKATNIFRGRVTDAYNNALPFSNITNIEDSIGTYSDARGYFILTSPDSVLNVQVRSLGFENNNVQLQNNVPNNPVQLQEDRSSLAEVVISNKKPNSNRTRDGNMVLQEPEPADGWTNYDLYLANNLKVPEVFKDKPSAIRGEVELAFDVDKNGEPVNITVRKSLCESCDKEAIRLIKEGPKWKRKAKKGKATVKIAF